MIISLLIFFVVFSTVTYICLGVCLSPYLLVVRRFIGERLERKYFKTPLLDRWNEYYFRISAEDKIRKDIELIKKIVENPEDYNELEVLFHTCRYAIGRFDFDQSNLYDQSIHLYFTTMLPEAMVIRSFDEIKDELSSVNIYSELSDKHNKTFISYHLTFSSIGRAKMAIEKLAVFLNESGTVDHFSSDEYDMIEDCRDQLIQIYKAEGDIGQCDLDHEYITTTLSNGLTRRHTTVVNYPKVVQLYIESKRVMENNK